jgi:hypothetical protein
MDNDDILLYLDCGCELNYLARDKFLKYIELVKTKKILGTETCSTDYNYTKMDLIRFFGMENDINRLKQNHMQACPVLMLKCDEIINLYNEYYEIGSSNYHLIDDTPSIEKNFNRFREHRHDQSVLSLLVKKNNLINYDLDRTWTNNFIDNFNETKKWPIWVARNKTGNSILEQALKLNL